MSRWLRQTEGFVLTRREAIIVWSMCIRLRDHHTIKHQDKITMSTMATRIRRGLKP